MGFIQLRFEGVDEDHVHQVDAEGENNAYAGEALEAVGRRSSTSQ